jgi:hypothetical protein
MQEMGHGTSRANQGPDSGYVTAVRRNGQSGAGASVFAAQTLAARNIFRGTAANISKEVMKVNTRAPKP